MRASGGPARRRHASQMRSSKFPPFLRLDARTGSLRLPATICSPNFRDGTLVMTTLRTGNYIDGDWRGAPGGGAFPSYNPPDRTGIAQGAAPDAGGGEAAVEAAVPSPPPWEGAPGPLLADHLVPV